MDLLLKNKIKELESRRKSQAVSNEGGHYVNEHSEKDNSSTVSNGNYVYDENNTEASLNEQTIEFSDYDGSEGDYMNESDQFSSMNEVDDVLIDDVESNEEVFENRQPLDNWVLRPINRDNVAVPLFPVNYVQKNIPNLHFPILSSENTKRLNPEVFFAEEMFSTGNSIKIGNITKVFLELKIGCFLWLSNFENLHGILGHSVVPALDTFFDLLKDGVLFAKILNTIWKIIHPNESQECCKVVQFDVEKPMKLVFQMREQLALVLQALSGKVGIPEAHLFELNDLFNKENILLVLITIRALSNNFSAVLRNRGETRIYNWPDMDIYEVAHASSSLALKEGSHISCIDEEASHLELLSLFAETPQYTVKKSIISMIEVVNEEFVKDNQEINDFELKQKIINTHLVQEIDRAKREAAIFKSSSFRENVIKEHKARQRPPSMDHLSPSQINAIEVYWWLCKMGVSQYYDLFLQDGWDSLMNVALMTEEDLLEMGITKRGHIKRFMVAIEDICCLYGMKSGRDKHRNIELLNSLPSRLEQERRWRDIRGLQNDKSAASGVWAAIREVRVKEKKLEDQLALLDEPNKAHKDTLKAISLLRSLIERQISTLVPLEGAIVIDIGWYEIKVGSVFDKHPKCVPTLCSFAKGRHLSAGLDINLSSEANKIKFRRVMHRGFDSIKEPNLIHYDDLIFLLKYIFRDLLCLRQMQKRPVLIVCNALQLDTRSKEKLMLLLFNQMKIKYCYISDPFTLVSYHIGISNGIFVDIGSSRITCCVIQDYKLLPGSILHSRIGLYEVHQQLMRLLIREDTGLSFHSVHKSKNQGGYYTLSDFQEAYLAQFILRKFGSVFRNRNSRKKSTEIGEYLSMHTLRKEADGNLLVECMKHVAPNKTNISLGNSPVMACEILFDEKYVTGAQSDHSNILDLIFACIKQNSYSRIGHNNVVPLVVFGGGSMLPGLGQRLSSELELDERRETRQFTINILQNGFRSSWEAGKDILGEPNFHSKWIEKYHFGSGSSNERIVSVDLKKLEALCPSGGCFPLVDPDNLLLECSKNTAAIHYLAASFQQDIATNLNDRRLDHSAQVALVKEKLQVICTILKKNYVRKERILEVQLAVSEKFLLHYQDKARLGKITTLDIIHSLPLNLKLKIQKYIDDIVSLENQQVS